MADNTETSATDFHSIVEPILMAYEEDIKQSSEMVNHPQHYGGDTLYEVIKVLEAWMTPAEYRGFLKGNAIKYLARAGKKAGRVGAILDEEKAAWYAERLKEFDKKLEKEEGRT